MVTLLNPEALIICGEGTDLGKPYLDPVVAAVRDQTFADQGRHVEVKIQSWGDEAWAVGAATLVLRESSACPPPMRQAVRSGTAPARDRERSPHDHQRQPEWPP